MNDCIDCEGRGWFHRSRVDPASPDVLVDRCETCARYTDDADAQEAHARSCATCLVASVGEPDVPELGTETNGRG